jgi:hypothetical protein
MPAPWTPPRTWVDGETPTGAQFNTQFRDNLIYLKENPSFDGNVTAVGDVIAGDDLMVADDATISGDLQVVGNTQLDGSAILGNAPADIVQVNGTVKGAPLQTYTETRTNPAIAAGALALDCALGTYFRVALNAAITALTFTNLPAAGRVLGITLLFTADGTVRAITWPASVKWPSGVAPTMSGASGKQDVITLITDDGGVTWLGVIVGQLY